ncbi:MAG: hypothetical protein WC246_02140 [Candidatus Paceibacterota bacterium]|jgi:hypothetical protein
MTPPSTKIVRVWSQASFFALMAIIVLACVVEKQSIPRANAASVQDQLLQTQQEVDKLFQLKDQSGIPDLQKQQLEIDIKKRIIADVIGVSKTQIEAVRNEIDQATIPQTDDWKRVVDSFGSLLDADEHYYQTIEDTIATNADLSNNDISLIAHAMEEHKTTIIDADIKHIQTVLATFNVKSILDIADAREQKIGSDVDKIYTKNLTQNRALKTSYTQAAALIADAHHADDSAQSIALNLYADQTDTTTQDFMKKLQQEISQWESSSTPASSTVTTTQSSGTTSDQAGEETPSTIRVRTYIESLVVRSLGDIQKAYGIFTQMSQNVKKYLQSN